MAADKKKVKVAIVGLGKVGSTFLKKLIAMEERGLDIVAVSELNEGAPGVIVAKNKSVPVFGDSSEIVAMGEAVDIIFDLTGNKEARSTLRKELARTGNQHTVIAPEVVAFLVWNLMGEEEELPNHAETGY